MRRILSLIFILMIISVLSNSCKKEKKNVNKSGKEPIEIEAFVIKTEKLKNIIQTSGDIIPGEMVELKCETAGRVVKLNITEGKYVKKGTVLLQVDDSELQARLRKLNAQLKLAKENEKRNKELLAINGISQVEYDAAHTELEAVEADIDLVNAQIRKCLVIAPFNGNLGLRNISDGAYISVGTPISILVQINPIKIEFTISEKYASFIKDGMPVEFTVAGSIKKYQGKIYASQSKIDQDSRTLTVRAICDNPSRELVPGAFADISIELEEINDAMMVPTQCIIPKMNGQNLWVCKDGKIQAIDVETGTRTEDMIQILTGVSIGDTIAVTGLLALKENMPVTISKIINE